MITFNCLEKRKRGIIRDRSFRRRVYLRRMKRDARYRVAVYKDSGIDDLKTLVGSIVSLSLALFSAAKAAKTAVEGVQKGVKDIAKTKQALDSSAAAIKDVFKRLGSVVLNFLKAKVKFIFRIKTGPDAEEN